MKVFIKLPAKVMALMLMLLISVPAFAQSKVSGLVLDPTYLKKDKLYCC